jgi:transposase
LNNAAERALRTAVQWRKIMFGNRSDNGERAIERLLTITRTCQLQQINALVYLTAAIVAHRRHQKVASLLWKAQTPELLQARSSPCTQLLKPQGLWLWIESIR